MFLGQSSKVKEIKAKDTQMGPNQTKFCTAKETTSKMKRQPTQRKEILVNNEADKGLISKIIQTAQTIQQETKVPN